MNGINKSLAIYIHWPFCLSKCPYCSFFSEVKKGDQSQITDGYIDELNFYHNLTSDKEVTSIFFGGGTPSLIDPQNIERLINHINKKWNITKTAEISLEANPNTNKPSLFKDIKNAGINRLSLGVQALNDVDLKFLGRSHSKKEALKAINDTLQIFNNHSMDLIYARPNQNIKNWEKELEEAVKFGFKHMSLYQLSIEEGTPFYKNNIQALDNDSSATLFSFTEDYLNIHGYPKYEVSNFAQTGFESTHNLSYWQGKNYLGIGKGAHGRITSNGKIYASTYSKKLQKLTPEERAIELVIMGLRIREGINKKHFYSQCGIEFSNLINKGSLQELTKLELIKDSENTICVTNQGLLVLDNIINQLIANKKAAY